MDQLGGDPSPRTANIAFTPSALQNMRLRGISRQDVMDALRDTSVQRVDEKTGHIVSRMGDVRIVTKRQGDGMLVMTALRRSEFSDDAG